MAKEVFAGIDFGGTRIKIGLLAQGRILARRVSSADSGSTFESNLEQMENELRQMLRKTSWQLNGMGICFPGIVDIGKSKILSEYVKYPDAQNLDLKYWVEKHFAVPFVVENDARAAMIGEWKYGVGRGYRNLVSITLGTGLGTAVLFNGEPMRGKHFIAGNLGGHFTINVAGDRCNCGNIGCVEQESSTWMLNELAKRDVRYLHSKLSKYGHIDYKMLFTLAEEGDELAVSLKEKSLKVWALGLINLIHAYDPELVIFSGGIMKSADRILPYFRDMIDRHAWIHSDDVKLAIAKHPDFAGIFGVYELLKFGG